MSALFEKTVCFLHDTDVSKFRCDEVITDPHIIPKDDNVTETSKIIMSTEIIDEPQLREDV